MFDFRDEEDKFLLLEDTREFVVKDLFKVFL